MNIRLQWKNISIAKKLYFVIGIMAFLIVGELFTLRFAMRNLSAVRAFVGGESLWSKAQKDAVFSLQRFGNTKNEKDYEAFLDFLKINEGDHQARMELLKKNPDMSIVRAGFLQGRIHSEDIEPIVDLLRQFYWVSYISHAMDTWAKGDDLLFKLLEAGKFYHEAIVSKDREKSQEVLSQIKTINEDLTVLEEDFSYILGEGSRWVERIVLSILTIAVVTVESIGLTLAFFISRAISRGLTELNEAAGRIGHGNFTQPVSIRSQDEIGRLGAAVNTMGQMLQKSYSDLELRVQERTSELAKMNEDNARLYEEAKSAVKSREEFLSIASHELKTPLTALYLQLQMLFRTAEQFPSIPEADKIKNMAGTVLRQAARVTTLLDELLDLTRLGAGKLELQREKCDLASIVADVVSQMSAESARAGSSVSLHSREPIIGDFDPTRIGQIVTNLLSNAIKYGQGKPIDVLVQSQGEQSVISVRDNGAGIPPEQQPRIFERFQRGKAANHISGLGLGLYITKQLVRAHGGTISVESAVGKGSTFTVRLGGR